MFSFLSSSRKKLEKWTERATTEDIQTSLTKTFIHGNPDEGVAKALSAPELSAFQKNFTQISQTSSPLAPILSVYGGYPFTPQSLPLSQDSLLRAVVALAGRDEVLNGADQLISPGPPRDVRVVGRGRDDADRLLLLFRALVGIAPGIEDVLDVLVEIQPRPNPCRIPLDRKTLRLMAERLGKDVKIEEIYLSKEKFVGFMKGLGLVTPDIGGDIDFEMFKGIVKDTPGLLDAIKIEAETFLRL